jgi:(R,R)-butanediol dehydrogenase/meso-butanediol dehydrogenase/diacetyl reductase
VICHGLGAPGGGLSEWTAVDERMVHRVPEGIDAVRAALVEPMSVAFRGVRLGRPRPGTCAVVLGAGPIGLGCWFALRALGIEDVVVSEPAASRRRVASSLGADPVLDPSAGDVVAAVLEHTRGAGADLAIDAAGNPASFRTGLALTGRGGRFVTLAAYTEAVAYNPTEIMMREIEIVSSFSTCGEFGEVLAQMQAGRYPLEGWVERVPFEDQLAAYERLHRGTAMKVLIDVAP